MRNNIGGEARVRTIITAIDFEKNGRLDYYGLFPDTELPFHTSDDSGFFFRLYVSKNQMGLSLCVSRQVVSSLGSSSEG